MTCKKKKDKIIVSGLKYYCLLCTSIKKLKIARKIKLKIALPRACFEYKKKKAKGLFGLVW